MLNKLLTNQAITEVYCVQQYNIRQEIVHSKVACNIRSIENLLCQQDFCFKKAGYHFYSSHLTPFLCPKFKLH